MTVLAYQYVCQCYASVYIRMCVYKYTYIYVQILRGALLLIEKPGCWKGFLNIDNGPDVLENHVLVTDDE